MKSKDLRDIRKKSIKELKEVLNKKKSELSEVNIDLSLGQENNFKKASLIKKDIAQIMTIIREKEIVEEMESDKENKRGESTKGRSSSGRKGGN